ncbi:MAG TPA: 2-dehydropantoate 2-reductase [Ktedonosporobacter sp.]|nr:2-dehydropantoate 2-reductase [Ktedonosporobacter sp.]
MRTTVDVIGVGGAGGFLASSLLQSSMPPRIISRGAALQRLRDVGLTTIVDGKRRIYTPVECASLDDVQEFAPLIILTTKSYDLTALLEEIAPRITEETLLVSIQNGFAAYDAICANFGTRQAAMGVLYVSAQIIAPGVIDIKPGIAQLFLPEQHAAELEDLVDALDTAGVEAALVDDIERRMWLKQIFLVPFAIVNAEMHQPIGKVLQNPQARQRWLALARELVAIARACDIRLPDDTAAISLTKGDRFDPQADTSFARDVWANRPNEAEALFAPLIQRAHKHNVSCPLLKQAYDHYHA